MDYIWLITLLKTVFIPEIINLKFNQNIQEFLTLFWGGGELCADEINMMKKVITTENLFRKQYNVLL